MTSPNNLQIFKNSDFGEIRTINEEGKIMFCGNDIARALGYKDPVNTLKQHCRPEGVAFRHILTNGGMQRVKFISEGNLYRLIVQSRLPSAVSFEKWVFDDVLPTLRKAGRYEIGEYPHKSTSVGEIASLLKILTRNMERQGHSYEMVATMIKGICDKFGIPLPEGYIKRNPFIQLSIVTAIDGIPQINYFPKEDKDNGGTGYDT